MFCSQYDSGYQTDEDRQHSDGKVDVRYTVACAASGTASRGPLTKYDTNIKANKTAPTTAVSTTNIERHPFAGEIEARSALRSHSECDSSSRHAPAHSGHTVH